MRSFTHTHPSKLKTPTYARNAYSHVIASSNARSRSLEVHPLHSTANVVALSYEVSEIFSCNFALHAHLIGFFLLFLNVLNTALQAFAELIGRIFECTADLGADAEGVGVRVVESCELC